MNNEQNFSLTCYFFLLLFITNKYLNSLLLYLIFWKQFCCCCCCFERVKIPKDLFSLLLKSSREEEVEMVLTQKLKNITKFQMVVI